MNSNPTIDNDLQKAIDDITKSTNSDPIFADPVAAPAPIPVQNPMEGFGNAPVPPAAAEAMDQARAASNSGAPMRPPMPPMPNQSYARPAARPAQNPAAPRPATPRPMMNARPAAPAPRPVANTPRPVAPAPRPAANATPSPMRQPANSVKMESFTAEAVDFSEPATNENYNEAAPNTAATPEMTEIRDAALRDLSKVIDKLDVTPAEKFDVYKEVHDNFGDDSVFAPAYKAASEMSDDKERGEALLYLVKSLGGDK